MRKVLIANRAEIAARLILACKELGLETVAVYAEPDLASPHIHLADEAYPLPGHTPAETYLDAEALLAVARESGADALHPGYGFLSERAAFATQVEAAGLTWVGPRPEAIALLGDKLAARRLAAEAGVPVLPGAVITGDPQSRPRPEDYPVMVKAASGGGGLGLRLVERPEAFEAAVAEARAQCEAAFAGGGQAREAEVYWEAFVGAGRHIEVQIAADVHGSVVALGERECSVQRRYQKVVEECPSAALDDHARAAIMDFAVRVARLAGYTNVGTVEFLWTPDGGPTLLEVNTRLQVEHPVTELVGGLDLAVAQLRLARGDRLDAVVPAWTPRGHAIEARLYAEDPLTGHPAPGRIDHLRWPGGPWVRVDAGVEAGATLSPYYDPLLAKIIAWGPDRETARVRLAQALARLEVAGTLTTNLALLRAITDDSDFAAGRLDTRFLSTHAPAPEPLPAASAAAAVYMGQRSPSPLRGGGLGRGPLGTPIETVSEAAAPNWARRRWR